MELGIWTTDVKTLDGNHSEKVRTLRVIYTEYGVVLHGRMVDIHRYGHENTSLITAGLKTQSPSGLERIVGVFIPHPLSPNDGVLDSSPHFDQHTSSLDPPLMVPTTFV